MVEITGKGFIGKNKFGIVKHNRSFDFLNIKNIYERLQEEKILSSKIKNFKRFPDYTKKMLLATKMAIFDAKIKNKKKFGLLAVNKEGALDSNVKYFKDYVDCGCKLARGSLFIYTLPTTPLAEIAIAFGIEGPLQFLTCSKPTLSFALEFGEDILKNKEATALIIIFSDLNEIISIVLENK